MRPAVVILLFSITSLFLSCIVTEGDIAVHQKLEGAIACNSSDSIINNFIVLGVANDTTFMQMLNANTNVNGSHPNYNGEQMEFTESLPGTYIYPYETNDGFCDYVYHVCDNNNGNAFTRRVLYIGDSGTDNPCNMKFTDLFFQDDLMSVEFVGTQDSTVCENCNNEGYSGKTFNWMMTSNDSPFVYNGKFDFENYLSSTGTILEINDWVIFQLGANDIGTSGACEEKVLKALRNFEGMAAHIKSVRPDLRIAIPTLTSTSNNPEHWLTDYPMSPDPQNYVYNCSRNFFNTQVIDRYPSSNVDAVINYHYYINRSTGFVNSWHLNSSGCKELAHSLYAFLKCNEF